MNQKPPQLLSVRWSLRNVLGLPCDSPKLIRRTIRSCNSDTSHSWFPMPKHCMTLLEDQISSQASSTNAPQFARTIECRLIIRLRISSEVSCSVILILSSVRQVFADRVRKGVLKLVHVLVYETEKSSQRTANAHAFTFVSSKIACPSHVFFLFVCAAVTSALCTSPCLSESVNIGPPVCTK